MIKRSIDFTVALVALIVTSPLLIVIVAIVRATSHGPALFRQHRLGKDGRLFEILKMRSMYVDSADVRNADGSTWSGPGDSRVTPIGRLLRSTSLDELPQFINVLRGEMSLVGPRPDLPDHIGYYSDDDKLKLRVRPGLTGLAQLSGRNSIAWEVRRKLDVEYVCRRSLALDLSILVRTIPYVLRRKDVYVDKAQ